MTELSPDIPAYTLLVIGCAAASKVRNVDPDETRASIEVAMSLPLFKGKTSLMLQEFSFDPIDARY